MTRANPAPAADVQQRVRPVVLELGQHHRQQAPGHGIVDGTGPDGHRAHGRAGEPFEMDDARQHRERRDAHAGPQEDHRRRERHARRKEPELGLAMHHPRQQRPEDKGRRHAGERDGDRAFQVAA